MVAGNVAGSGGSVGRPRERAWLLVLLAGTTVVYGWRLSAQGWANSYYAAAVQAGTRSWTAFFFGSLDAGNFITVDKPPFALWMMELSARLFGLSSGSMLLPDVLAGTGSVALVYAAVRRWSGPLAGLVAGVGLALTPAAVVMFRFNNPDAVLTLLLVAAGYATVRATERAGPGWLLLAAVLVGAAFVTKYLQAYLALPPLALTYLTAAPARLRVRLAHLLAAGLVLLAASGWWLLAVLLTPAAARPYVGGSGSSNSVWRLAVGVVGIDRLTGGGQPAGGGTGLPGRIPGGGLGGGRGFAGPPGLLRMFNAEVGGQGSWLLPAAGLALLAGLWATRRVPRTDLRRAGYLLWGLWTLTDVAVFSLMGGVLHPYYVVALAPAVAALFGMGAAQLWTARQRVGGPVLAALAVLVTGCWASLLLGRTPGWLVWLRPAVLAGTAGVAAGLVLAGSARIRPAIRRRMLAGLGVAGLTVALAGPAAYAGQTVSTARTGGDPLAGPPGAAAGPGAGLRAGRTTGPPPPPTALAAYLTAHRGGATWVAATSDANLAAGLQLATGRPVMALGGFTGADTAISLAGFQQRVRAGQVRYFVAVGGPGGYGSGRLAVLPDRGGRPGARPDGRPGARDSGVVAIAAWVRQTAPMVTYGGSGPTLYDLSASPTVAGR